MKTQSSDKIEIIAKLASIVRLRKNLEKEERELKEIVKSFMQSETCLEAGQFIVLITKRSRTDLDKDALMHDMGHKFIEKYSRISTYEILEIKPKERVA